MREWRKAIETEKHGDLGIRSGMTFRASLYEAVSEELSSGCG
jgi:hypothetical protein